MHGKVNTFCGVYRSINIIRRFNCILKCTFCSYFGGNYHGLYFKNTLLYFENIRKRNIQWMSMFTASQIYVYLETTSDEKTVLRYLVSRLVIEPPCASYVPCHSRDTLNISQKKALKNYWISNVSFLLSSFGYAAKIQRVVEKGADYLVSTLYTHTVLGYYGRESRQFNNIKLYTS